MRKFNMAVVAAAVATVIEIDELRDVGQRGEVRLVQRMVEARSAMQEGIKKLVLLDSIAYAQHIPIFFRMLDVPLVSHLGVRMVPPTVQTRVALRIAYFDDSKIDPEEVETYAAPLKTAAGKHAIIYSARQIVPDNLDEIAESYKSITLPTLILWCDHDRIVPLEVVLKLRRALPNSSLRLVPDCGHMPQEEQPASTLDLLQDFIGG